MAVFNNNLLAGAGAQSSDSTYKIDQSIRFNASDYPKMTRTPSSAGNRRTFTLSTWIKRGALSTDQVVFGSYINTTNYFLIYFDSTNHSTDNTFRVYEYNGNVLKFWVYGTQKFRDPSAWYHFVVSVDTTNAVSNERIRLYVNGSRITDLTQNQQPSLNYETYINSTNLQTIGEFYGNYYHFDGYMAEMHLLDGYAYDPSFFGEFNDSGIWIPKEYTGSYGTNGFKIDGRDSSDLGDDESGQGNDYTTSGLAAHDQVSDSPTNNFATFNPVMTNDSDFEFSEGNLKLDMNTNKSWYVGAGASMSMTSGKWYWESYWNSGDSYTIWGILDTEQLHALAGSGSTSIYALNFNGIQPNSSGTNDQYRQGQGGSAIATGQAGAPGGIWQFALDMDNKKMWLGYNGTYVGSGDPAGGTNETWSSTYIASDSYTPINQGYQISAHSILTYNFGQDSTFAGATSAGGNSDASGIGNFKYSVPSGFKALCTKNLGS